MRRLNARLAVAVSGILLMAIAFGAGVFDSRKAIVIEYGMLGDEAIGAEVYIDDELAGTLQSLSAATRTGFEVAEGAHVVRVVHPDFGSRPLRVETAGSSSSVVLRLDVASMRDPETGRPTSTLVLN